MNFLLPPVQVSRVSVVGIGNEMNGDDAAGVLVTRMLAEQLKERGALTGAPLRFQLAGGRQVQVIEGGLAPENFTGPIRRFAPELVMLVDAAETGSRPGEILVADWRAAEGYAGSTHTLPPFALSRFLVEEIGCQVVLIGIQPAQLEYDTPVSHFVQGAVNAVVHAIFAALLPGENS